ncbi:MAG: hypothetical protein ABJN36_15860 [Cyclobacteriaceae bacterium]
MKKLAFIALCFALACQQPQPKEQMMYSEPIEESPDRDVLTGAWSMTSMYLVNNFNGDTTWIERKQYKLYVDGNVMWGFEAAPDSTEWFGYGKYRLDGDTLRETMVSGSNSFREVLADGSNMFAMDLTIFGDSYTQVQRDDSVTTYEVYDRIR